MRKARPDGVTAACQPSPLWRENREGVPPGHFSAAAQAWASTAMAASTESAPARVEPIRSPVMIAPGVKSAGFIFKSLRLISQYQVIRLENGKSSHLT
jgi:hypothetical protein